MAKDDAKLAPALARCHIGLVRCPYCVQGNEFKIMVDLTGSAGGTYYCTSCRHLVRTGDPDFRCLCPNCRAMDGAAKSA